MREPFLAVGRVLGDVADLAEGLDQVVGGVAVVFDDQEAHGDPVRSLPYVRPRSGNVCAAIVMATVPETGAALRPVPADPAQASAPHAWSKARGAAG